MFKKALFTIAAILLIPAVSAALYTSLNMIVNSSDFTSRAMYFLFGFASYVIFFLAFKKPLVAYVFGHELTHVLWVLMFSGKVDSMKVSRKGGYIKANRKNFLILLAPYFFPIYTILVIVAYILISYFYDISRYFPIAAFAIGFSWSFHILLNAFAMTKSQDDFEHTGTFFSIVLVVLCNIFILGLLVAFISGSVNLRGYMDTLGHNIPAVYTLIGDGIKSAASFIVDQANR
jgi:hypothetical protein